jgi:hypothetical protein
MGAVLLQILPSEDPCKKFSVHNEGLPTTIRAFAFNNIEKVTLPAANERQHRHFASKSIDDQISPQYTR